MNNIRILTVTNFVEPETLSQYASRASDYLTSKGYAVEIGTPIKFEARRIVHRRQIFDLIASLIAVTAPDGDYFHNPLTGAYGKGYIENFINMKEIGRDGIPTVCVTDVPVFTTGSQMSVPYGWFLPKISWVSVRNPRTDEMLDDKRFFEYLEEEVTKYSTQSLK